MGNNAATPSRTAVVPNNRDVERTMNLSWWKKKGDYSTFLWLFETPENQIPAQFNYQKIFCLFTYWLIVNKLERQC
jgi:hypothetical protein